MALALITVSSSRSVKAVILPSEEPTCLWSAPNGDTLVGPDAMLAVTWTGGDHPIVNNTLEFQVGNAVFVIHGTFKEGEVVPDTNPDHVHEVHVPAGTYHLELSWDDRFTDLDGYIYSDSNLEDDLGIDMVSLAFPEETTATFTGGNYWIVVDWFEGTEFPLSYMFYAGTEDYYYWSPKTFQGPNQTVNTGNVPDDTYEVTATCYDSAGNSYNETRVYTTSNQFPPEIDWVKINGNDVVSAIDPMFERGTIITIEWQASDPNSGDDILASMFFKKPGISMYSLLFSAWTETSYTVDWDKSAFENYGNYSFKLEVLNEIGELSPAGTIEFSFTVIPATITETTSSDTPTPPVVKTPAFAGISVFATLVILFLDHQRKKKR
jgi:hypothetical protein